MGIGHLMRCLAIAQACKDEGGRAFFISATNLKEVEKRLYKEEMEVLNIPFLPGSSEDAMESTKLASKNLADWIIIDGYQFGANYQRMIKDEGLNLLKIDDFGDADHYFADIVLNQNIMGYEDLYRNKEPYTRILMGPKYILLRREFRKWGKWKKEVPEIARRILLTMGGTDPVNMTLRVLMALQKLNFQEIELTLVLGASEDQYRSLISSIKSFPFPVKIEMNVVNMPEFMAWADMAIISGGTTAWELAFMGIPCLIIPIAENQRYVVEMLQSEGAAINIGWYNEISEDKIRDNVERLISDQNKRSEMSIKGRNLVDGQGVNRILDILKEKIIRLRPAREDDCNLIWKWANYPEVRDLSFSSVPIPLEDHIKWFNSKIKDPNCIIFIATDQKDLPMGVVRFDLEGKEAVISVTLDRNFRGMGYGKRIISIASHKLFEISSIEKINAYVKLNNENSYHAFLKANFKYVGEKITKGQMAHNLIFQK
jgi:UDP-2,4-diacetamido-2,4,6-trideoxy-beta-L-altropyranose hydrolase